MPWSVTWTQAAAEAGRRRARVLRTRFGSGEGPRCLAAPTLRVRRPRSNPETVRRASDEGDAPAAHVQCTPSGSRCSSRAALMAWTAVRGGSVVLVVSPRQRSPGQPLLLRALRQRGKSLRALQSTPRLGHLLLRSGPVGVH